MPFMQKKLQHHCIHYLIYIDLRVPNGPKMPVHNINIVCKLSVPFIYSGLKTICKWHPSNMLLAGSKGASTFKHCSSPCAFIKILIYTPIQRK